MNTFRNGKEHKTDASSRSDHFCSDREKSAMSFVFVVVLLMALSAHTGHGFPAAADHPAPFVERQVSVKGRFLCGAVPAESADVSLHLVDWGTLICSRVLEVENRVL